MPQDIFDKIKQQDVFDKLATKPKPEPLKGVDDPTRDMEPREHQNALWSAFGGGLLGPLSARGPENAQGEAPWKVPDIITGLAKAATSSLPEQWQQLKGLPAALQGRAQGITSADPLQRAETAGQLTMELPAVIQGARGVAKGVKSALPSRARAGANLDTIRANIGEMTQDMTQPSNVAARMRELQMTGHGSMPGVATAVERRTVGPASLGKPVTYSEGFDMASAAGKLSAAEKMAMKGQMPSQVKKLADALRTSNREVAVKAGMGELYDAAIKEYRQAARLSSGAGAAVKIAAKYVVPTVGSVAAWEAIKKVFGK